MKKCKKCGALQNDERNVCLDCGTLLGNSMTDKEEAIAEEALENTLDAMAESTEDFYVPVRDKFFGVFCIIGIVAAVLLLWLSVMAKNTIMDSVPDTTDVFLNSDSSFVSLSGSADAYSFPMKRYNQLDDAATYALIGVFCCIAAFPLLLFPRFMWFIDTLKYRVFYGWETTPSDFALAMRKIIAYISFAIGMGSVIYGYILYL